VALAGTTLARRSLGTRGAPTIVSMVWRELYEDFGSRLLLLLLPLRPRALFKTSISSRKKH
jgi:hypothetical protein